MASLNHLIFRGKHKQNNNLYRKISIEFLRCIDFKFYWQYFSISMHFKKINVFSEPRNTNHFRKKNEETKYGQKRCILF